MTDEIEPTYPDSEHDIDNSDTLTQEWIVQGLVVDIVEGKAKYVVTAVLSGSDKIFQDRYHFPELNSPMADFILSPEKLMDYPYRSLVSDGYYRHAEKDDHELDELIGGDDKVAIGDKIQIIRWSQKIPYEYDAFGGGAGESWSVEKFDDVTVLESSVDINKEEASVLRKKHYIRKNLAGILRRLEQLRLQKRERLQTNVEAAITWDHDGQNEGVVARYVYGEGLIEDHFVTLSAEPYSPNDEVPLPGDLRFTQSGRSFLQRDIIVGEPSKELALINEPLLELSASIWTETAYNPEVGNVRVDYIVDSVRYAGSIDIESSTRSFRSPGHHLEFKTFSDITVQYDGVEIKSDETDAIFKYQDVVRKLRFQASRAGIEARHIQKELGGSLTTDILSTQTLLQELQLARLEAYRDIQPIVEQINARPSDTKFGGVRLLVPRSKLASVRVVIYQTTDSTEV